MSITAQFVSKKQDNETLCRPPAGYARTIDISLDQYEEEVDIVDEKLPDSDEKWPKGSPLLGYVKLGNKILN